MAVTRRFPARVSIDALFAVLDSLGAHLAAKLEQFGTDERTLTDELCDMFFIWCLGRFSARRRTSQVSPAFELDAEVTKTSQQEEAVVGTDLAFHIAGPRGVKRALFQAKVFDPEDNRLRCDSTAGWDKLWAQLCLMQRQSPDLSFLLIYVPMRRLDGQTYGFATWEQGLRPAGSTQTPSRYGITLVPLDQLIDNQGDWHHWPPVEHLGGGRFRPRGISLSRLVKDMLVCARGSWEPRALYTEDLVLRTREGKDRPVHYLPYRQVGLSFQTSDDTWERLVRTLAQTPEENDPD